MLVVLTMRQYSSKLRSWVRTKGKTDQWKGVVFVDKRLSRCLEASQALRSWGWQRKVVEWRYSGGVVCGERQGVNWRWSWWEDGRVAVKRKEMTTVVGSRWVYNYCCHHTYHTLVCIRVYVPTHTHTPHISPTPPFILKATGSWAGTWAGTWEWGTNTHTLKQNEHVCTHTTRTLCKRHHECNHLASLQGLPHQVSHAWPSSVNLASFYFNTSLSTSQRWCGTQANSCNTQHSQENKDPTSDGLLDTDSSQPLMPPCSFHPLRPEEARTLHMGLFHWQRTRKYRPPSSL